MGRTKMTAKAFEDYQQITGDKRKLSGDDDDNSSDKKDPTESEKKSNNSRDNNDHSDLEKKSTDDKRKQREELSEDDVKEIQSLDFAKQHLRVKIALAKKEIDFWEEQIQEIVDKKNFLLGVGVDRPINWI